MAEAVGFEPTIPVRVCRFSRPVPSTARPRFLLLVPRVGIEPTLLSEPDFESGASTNFTTEAGGPPGSRTQHQQIMSLLL